MQSVVRAASLGQLGRVMASAVPSLSAVGGKKGEVSQPETVIFAAVVQPKGNYEIIHLVSVLCK